MAVLSSPTVNDTTNDGTAQRTQDENGNAVTPYSITESGTQLWQNGLSFTVPANTTLVLQ